MLLALEPNIHFEHFIPILCIVPEAYGLAQSLCMDGTSAFPFEAGVSGNCVTLL